MKKNRRIDNKSLAIILAIIPVIGTIFVALLNPDLVKLLLPGPTQQPTLASTTSPVFTETSTPATTTVSTSTPIETPTQIPLPMAYTISMTEVMVNPCGFDSTRDSAWNEYIELYNYGDYPVDVGGLWITDGSAKDGNPDFIVSWNTRYPGTKLGNKQTDTTIIPPNRFALILSPLYFLDDSSFRQPYVFPEDTILLTVGDGNFLGSDDYGIEIAYELDIIMLYKGTGENIDQIISTYGTPKISSSPTNLSDDGLDKIPLNVPDCFAVERKAANGDDNEFNWQRLLKGSPGK